MSEEDAGRAGAVTRADVVRAARRRFLRGERIDVLALAGELGVGRATLYRWFGDRDALIGHVLFSLSWDTLTAAIARRHRTAEGLARALTDNLRVTAQFPAFRAFIAADPGRALTVLTGRDSVVARGYRERLAAMLQERYPGVLGDDLPAEELAYMLVRVGESYIYADLIAGRDVDVDQALPMYRRLLAA